MNRTGLVLEGGAMRGIYTAGVLDVFLEEGIHFDGVIGVSAGAIHGISYVAKQKGRSIRYYKKVLQRPAVYEFLEPFDHGKHCGRKILLSRSSGEAGSL